MTSTSTFVTTNDKVADQIDGFNLNEHQFVQPANMPFKSLDIERSFKAFECQSLQNNAVSIQSSSASDYNCNFF
jgi:hypothetical protein